VKIKNTACDGKTIACALAQVSSNVLNIVIIAVRDEGQLTCNFDSGSELTLILRLGASDTAWNDFTVLSEILAQGIQIFVIDLRNAFGSEFAELTAAEKFRHSRLLN
jgi:hypothetical protein